MKEIHIKIYGKVQGIFFRVETKKIADELGLVGCVKNMNDGTVEILAQGDLRNLHKLEEWSHKGPRLAKVEKVESEYRDIEKKCEDFIIDY